MSGSNIRICLLTPFNPRTLDLEGAVQSEECKVQSGGTRATDAPVTVVDTGRHAAGSGDVKETRGEAK